MKEALFYQLQKKEILPVITGATASGKTSLAAALAHQIQGEIISVDSRQVYRGMNLGTGKDLFEYEIEGEKIPYHCIDITDPKNLFTLQDYQKACYEAISEIKKRGKIPILCGGTGLYLEAVLKNYQIPPVKENSTLRNRLATQSKESLEKRLQELSLPLYRKTDLSSKKRIIRSIEIALSEKNDFSNLQEIPTFIPCILILSYPKETLHKRIDLRLEKRLQEGMIEEVQHLIDQGITLERLKLFGMEYRFVGSYLFKEISYDEMKKSLTGAIHRLAKRQKTWFNGMSRRGLSVHFLEEPDLEKVSTFLQNFVNNLV